MATSAAGAEEKMKLLTVTESFTFGGLETNIASEVRCGISHGIESFLAVGSSFSPESVPADVVQTVSGLPLGVDEQFAYLKHPTRSASARNALSSYITGNGIDVVHAHPFGAFLPSYLAARDTQRPLIATLHGPDNVAGVFGERFDRITHEILRSASLVISVSPETQELAARYGISSMVVPNGVAPSQLRARSWPDPAGARWLLVGRLDQAKGVGLMECVRQLLLTSPECIDIAGDGPFRAQMELELDGVGEVRFLGRQTDVPTLMRNYDVVGAMGRAMLESVMQGIPTCLVGYQGPVRLMAQADDVSTASARNFSGRGMPVYDPATFHESLVRLRGKSADSPTNFVREHFDEQTVWEPLMELIHSGLPPITADAAQAKQLAELAREPLFGENARMKILFLAPKPTEGSERDGYLQRIAAIDSLFPDAEKLYAADVEHDNEQFASAVAEADVVYVHSIYQAERYQQVYLNFGTKVVTDLHGVVPEEVLMMSQGDRAEELDEVEALVFEHSSTFVAVTNAMRSHFAEKYPVSRSADWVILPIFGDLEAADPAAEHDPHAVVYAGGSQVWQCVDLMLGTIRNARADYRFTIVTQDPEAFAEVNQTPDGPVEVLSVAPTEVADVIRHASFGLVFRDESVVNRVACPTKIIEYLALGIIPVVTNPLIGDFTELGYHTVSRDDFLQQKFSPQQLTDMRTANADAVRRLQELQSKGQTVLVELCSNLASSLQPVKPGAIKGVSMEAEERILKSALNDAAVQLNERVAEINELGVAHRQEVALLGVRLTEYHEMVMSLRAEIDGLRGSLPVKAAERLRRFIPK